MAEVTLTSHSTMKFLNRNRSNHERSIQSRFGRQSSCVMTGRREWQTDLNQFAFWSIIRRRWPMTVTRLRKLPTAVIIHNIRCWSPFTLRTIFRFPFDHVGYFPKRNGQKATIWLQSTPTTVVYCCIGNNGNIGTFLFSTSFVKSLHWYTENGNCRLVAIMWLQKSLY